MGNKKYTVNTIPKYVSPLTTHPKCKKCRQSYIFKKCIEIEPMITAKLATNTKPTITSTTYMPQLKIGSK